MAKKYGDSNGRFGKCDILFWNLSSDILQFLINFGSETLTMQLEKKHRISCWNRQTASVSPCSPHPHSVFVSSVTLKKHMWEYHVGPARPSVFPPWLPKHATFSALSRRVLACITYPTPLYLCLHHHTSYATMLLILHHSTPPASSYLLCHSNST